MLNYSKRLKLFFLFASGMVAGALIFAVAILLESDAPSGITKGIMSVSDLITRCEQCGSAGRCDHNSYALAGECEAFVMGVLAASPIALQCSPKSFTLGQSVKLFLAWSRRNPESGDEPAVYGVVKAHTDSFSCRSGGV